MLSDNPIKYDVAVVGAGVSGVPAAVAASRAGAKTLLLERTRRLGGTMPDSFGFPICGLFKNDTSRRPELLNNGLPGEFFSIISKESPDSVVAMGRVYVCQSPLSQFESIYSNWIEEKNLTVCFDVDHFSLETQNNQIRAVQFQGPDGMCQTCTVGAVVDCTGGGEVITQCGAEQIVPNKLPLSGFSVHLRGVENDALLPIKVPYALRKAAESGEIPSYGALTVYSDGENGSSFCKFSVPSETSRANAEQTARKVLQSLQKQIPALRSMEIVEFSPEVLHREGVRLKGDIVLSAEDVRTGRRFSDAVAQGAWPMEYWDEKTGPRYEFSEDDSAYDIPLRALHSVNIQNLWAAGRAVSADSMALASVRVMGLAMATGEAAGRAAAESLK
jgi:hypothetical protein